MAIKKTIEIEIKDNVNVTTDHFEDLNDEIKAVKKQADDLSKSFESNGDAIEKSFKPLKTQFREAQQQVAELSEKFGATSKQAIEAAKRAAELKDAIGDAKDLTDAFNPDAKFNALSNSIGGALNGFQAFEGTLGLIGVESEDLQKTLLKVQSAMALSQGLQGLMEAKDSFIQLGAVIKTQVVSAFATLKGAIIATGLGALAVAVGYLIVKWQEYNDAIEESENRQKKLNEEQQKSLDLINKIADASEKNRNAKDGGINQLKRELELLKARGATEKELFEKQKEILKAELSNLQVRYYSYDMNNKLEREAALETKEKIKDARVALIAFEAQYYREIKEKREENSKQAKENAKKEKEEKLRIKREELKELQGLEDERFKLHQEATYSDQELEIARLVEQFDKKFEIANGNAELEKELETKLRQEIADINAKYNIHDVEETKKTEDKKVEILKATEEQKLQGVKDGFTTISNLAQLFAGQSEAQQKKAFEVQKAANIANTLVDTYSSATASYKSLAGIPIVGPALGFAAAAAAVTAGLINVKNISQQQFNSGSSGGGGNNSSSNANVPQEQQAPSFNLVGNGGIGQLQTLNQAPVQAYVVSGEVTSQQALDRNRLRNATF